jgi:hypothetical protein
MPPGPPNHPEPNTIAHQRVTSKQLAISAWQARRNADKRLRRTSGVPRPPTPPSGELPPLIIGVAGGSRTASANHHMHHRPRVRWVLASLHTARSVAQLKRLATYPVALPQSRLSQATYLAPVAPDLSVDPVRHQRVW